MPGKEHLSTTPIRSEIRKLIGQAIIDGLLSPAGLGVIADDYSQSDGGYWQGSGSHVQSSGDYHQGKTSSLGQPGQMG